MLKRGRMLVGGHGVTAWDILPDQTADTGPPLNAFVFG
jgi:hypothetical protein